MKIVFGQAVVQNNLLCEYGLMSKNEVKLASAPSKNNPLLRITLLECVTTNFRFENRTNSAVPVLNSVTQSPSEKALILDTYKKHVFQGLIHKFSTWFCSSGTVLTCIFMYEKCFQSMYFQSWFSQDSVGERRRLRLLG